MRYNTSVCEHCPEILTGIKRLKDNVGYRILYYIFPVIFIGGIIFGLINIIVIGRNIRNSRDSYFLALVLSGTLLLLFGGVLRLSDYTEVTQLYYTSFGYLCGIHNWLYFTSIWILLSASLGRTLHVSGANSQQILTTSKASIVSVIVYCVCFLSMLPQFWYCTNDNDIPDDSSLMLNHTAVYYTTPKQDKSHNHSIYLWYTFTITIFIPFPVYSICIFFLSKVVRLKRNSRRRHSLQHGTGNILNRQATGQMRVNRLFISLITSLLLLVGPKLIMKFLVYVSRHDSLGPAIVTEVFELLFYLYFMLPLFLFCKYSQSFRSTMVHTFCYCMKQRCQRQLEKAYSIHEL